MGIDRNNHLWVEDGEGRRRMTVMGKGTAFNECNKPGVLLGWHSAGRVGHYISAGGHYRKLVGRVSHHIYPGG